MEKPLWELFGILNKHGFTLEEAIELFNKFNNVTEFLALREQFKEQPPQEEGEDVFQKLKKVGFLVEKKANAAIQQGLNKKEIIQKVYHSAKDIAPLVRDLSRWVETISIPLNLPTKNDVANVAKLTLQNEEKLESIEKQIRSLEKNLTELLEGENSGAQGDTLPSKEISSKEYKKLLILQHILQTSNLSKKD